MAKIHFVKAARKNYPGSGIRKGDSYYWWKLRYRSKMRSRRPPRPSQLTTSEFLARLMDWETERLVNHGESYGEVLEAVDSRLREIENLRDQQEEKRGNIPWQLQDSPVGELLRERYEHLDDLWSTLNTYMIDLESELENETDTVAEDMINDLNDIYYSI